MIDFRQPTVLFGGSFDPVHEGHLQLAIQTLAQRPEIKQLVFVPVAESPGKKSPTAPAEQRLRWLRLSVEPLGFHVWNWELLHSGPSYTVNTLEEAHRQGASRNNLYWLLGADAYAEIKNWKNPARIRELCKLLVVNRAGYESSPQDPADQFISIPTHPASSTQIRAELKTDVRNAQWLPEPVRAELENALPGSNPYARKNL